MKRSNESLPVQIAKIQGRFDGWRGRRKRGERIPERLWRAATEAAQRYGVHRVSRALNLEHAQLKRRAEDATDSAGAQATEALFVEVAGRSEPASGCVVELQKENGTKMRICVRDAATVDWCRMKEAFLGA